MNGLRRLTDGDVTALEPDLPRCKRAGAKQALQQGRLSLPLQTGQTDDFARIGFKTDATHALARNIRYLEAGDCGGTPLLASRCCADIADHIVHDGLAGGGRRIQFGNRRAIAHHGDAVADGKDLIETVGNHDGGDAVGLLGPKYLKKALRLAAIERRRRLVHDHQAGILGEYLEDFDKLALIRRQRADDRIRLQPFASHAVKQRDQSARFGLQRLAVDKDAAFRLTP
ncbi:hypothetical protein D3C86_1181680 [compost metagenome]